MNYAPRVLNLSFRRDFNRAARFLGCIPFEAARSIVDTVSRYADCAASLFFSDISFNNFFMDDRKAERWLIFCTRRFAFCRARFLAWGELAKGFPRIFWAQLMGSTNGGGNIVNFAPKVKAPMRLSC